MGELPVQVETTRGRVEGAREGAVVAFRGIPFARAPVGPLRFAAPRPAAAWSGVRAARTFGAIPPQLPDPLSQSLGLETDLPQHEDCLHLNVWTPEADAGRRPVLVWIHGGGFATGSGAAPVYDGSRLAQRGDVVVVTLNYRVGALGFLYLGGFTGAGSASDPAANCGLLDQMRALEWVHDEVARFGGDPDCVTVFGESAGAGSIVSLLAMPASRGLIRRAIVQSAAPEGMLCAEEATARARRLLAEIAPPVASSGGDLAELRSLPVAALLDAQQRCLEAGWAEGGMLFMPVVDLDTLPRAPAEAIAVGDARDVDLIIGTTAEELRLYARDPFFRSIDAKLLERVLERRLGERPDAQAAARELIETYRAARSARGEGVEPLDLFCALETDRSLRVPSLALAEAHAGHGGRSFAYVFSWRSPLEGGLLGACHALDLPFTFGTLDVGGMPDYAGKGPEAEALSAAMMDAWVAFARTGDPSHAGIGTWPGYDAARRATFELGPERRVVHAPCEPERAAWARLRSQIAAGSQA